jgi:flagellar motor switch protein FliN/FliY
VKLGRIGEVQVALEVVLGRTQKSVEHVAEIGPGTIIELESIAGEPVELRAGGELIGHGEVVVIDESFGLRVTSVVSDSDGGEPHGRG